MGRGLVWEGKVRLARRAEEADPQRSVTDKQRRQRDLPSQTLRAAGLSGLDCAGSGGTDRCGSAPRLTALPKPEFPSRRTLPIFRQALKVRRIRGLADGDGHKMTMSHCRTPLPETLLYADRVRRRFVVPVPVMGLNHRNPGNRTKSVSAVCSTAP